LKQEKANDLAAGVAKSNSAFLILAAILPFFFPVKY